MFTRGRFSGMTNREKSEREDEDYFKDDDEGDEDSRIFPVEKNSTLIPGSGYQNNIVASPVEINSDREFLGRKKHGHNFEDIFNSEEELKEEEEIYKGISKK
jgi:hypothetical protein